MTTLLHWYVNGNYTVEIYSDGTKIRETLDPAETKFRPEFSENIDIKITNFCNANCGYCHDLDNSCARCHERTR